MKFELLETIVSNYAEQLRLGAAYNGSYHDGGSSLLLGKLKEYKDGLVVEMDLRPSEFHKLNEVEVGEPKEFSTAIEAYRMELAKNIKL